jgi:hypothetical protein
LHLSSHTSSPKPIVTISSSHYILLVGMKPALSLACYEDHPKIAESSLSAQSANELIYGDGKAVLFRVPDELDDPTKWNSKIRLDPNVSLKLLPASFLVHASMRSSNTIFSEHSEWSVALMAGSKLSLNNVPEEGGDPSLLVNMTACYPGDAGTIKRLVLTTDFGGGCRGDQYRIPGSCGVLDGNSSICFMDRVTAP